jgi:hypothetical protein
MERKRLEIAKQREDLEKKQAEEEAALDNTEKDRILNAFEKENKAKREALENDRKQQKFKLQNRLRAKKEKAKEIEAAKAPPEAAPPKEMVDGAKAAAGMSPSDSKRMGDSFRGKGKKLWNEVVDRLHGGKSTHSPRSRSASKRMLSSSGASFSSAQGGDPAQTAAISQIEQKLERIEKMMTALAEKGAKPAVEIPAVVEPAPAPAPPPMPVSFGYLDSNEPVPGETLEVVQTDRIHVQERARVEFGQRVATMVGLKNLKIRPARSLPETATTGNAFGNSYMYDPTTDELFVHQDRLSSSGDFGLIVIHALSHIKINPADLSNDADPAFMTEFYKNLKILSQELYKKSAGVSSAVLTSGSSPLDRLNRKTSSTGLLPIVESPRREESVSPRRNDNVSSSADDHASPLDDTTSSSRNAAMPTDYFSSKNMQERIRMYVKEGGIPPEFVERYAAELRDRRARGGVPTEEKSPSI